MLSKDSYLSKTVFFIGGGPATLAAALSVLRHTQHNVVILTDRVLGIFKRPQYTTVFSDTAKLLKQDEDKIADPKHEKYLARANPLQGIGTEALKRTERALFRQLELFITKSPSRVTIYNKAVIDNIDTDNQEIVFDHLGGKRQKHNFDILVFSEGAHRSTLQKFIFNKNPPLLKLIEQDVGYPWPYHASIILQQNQPMKKKSEAPISRVEQTPHTRKHLPEFQLHGWTEKVPPHSICLTNLQNTKVTISTEIPEQIFSEHDKNRQRDRLVQYGRLMARLQLNLKEDKNLNIKLTSKDSHLRATVFTQPLKLQRVDKVAIKLTSGGYLVIIGDAAFNVDYRTGEGVNRAIALGDKFGKSFHDGRFDLAGFNQFAEKMAADIAKSCYAENKSIDEKRAILEEQDTTNPPNTEEQSVPFPRSRL